MGVRTQEGRERECWSSAQTQTSHLTRTTREKPSKNVITNLLDFFFKSFASSLDGRESVNSNLEVWKCQDLFFPEQAQD